MPKKNSHKLNIRPGRLAQIFTPIVIGAAVLGGIGTGVHKFFDGETKFRIDMYDDDLVDELPKSFKDYLGLRAEYEILMIFDVNNYKYLVGDNDGQDIRYDDDKTQRARNQYDKIENGRNLLNNWGNEGRRVHLGWNSNGMFDTDNGTTGFTVSEHVFRVSRASNFRADNIYEAIFERLDGSLFEAYKAHRAGTYDDWHKARMQDLQRWVWNLNDHELMPSEYSKGLKELRRDLERKGYPNPAETATPALQPAP